MICIRCASENAPSFRFCWNCGTQLGQTCLACDFENPPESKFCGGCGARLEEVRVEDARGERRQLTVLFCDVVGSTELSHVLDPEDLGGLIGMYQRICGEAVTAHEGHIAQYLGDGVVIYFGYPRSHEDEAQRAVRCGLAILEAARALRESGTIPPETPVDVRLGAHTGRVVVGPVGAGDRRDRIALGDTPNIAAHIQSQAEPGTLTVSEATWTIVHWYFKGKDLGKTPLKGLPEPMRLWLVTGESGSRERVEAATTLTPFVGREPERSALEQAWNDARTGRSQFVLVRGEPGIGKSRLAQLFRDQVQFSATDLLVMRATPYDSNSAFHPVIDLIARKFRFDSARDQTERLDRLEDGLRGLKLARPEAVELFAALLSIPLGDRYTPLEFSPARQRSLTMELLVEFFAGVAGEGPTLLLAEDLHWADTSTLELLELLVTTAPGVPLLAVLTARPEFTPDWLVEPAVRAIELAKFERTEAETIARGVAFGKALPSDVLRHIVARSDGVPLFVEELTHSILNSGVLTEKGASWEAHAPVSAEMIPASVDAWLTSRIDRLGASRATAQLAATIGRSFSFELLSEVSERQEATLRQDLERLVQSGLAWPVGEDTDTFEFKHALVRDAAYSTLLRSTRQSYHRRIAAALRDRFPDQASSRPDLIAGHLTSAGDDEEAIAFWEAGGQQALAQAALHEAAEHFQRAIDCLGRLPATQERQERELELQILVAPLLMSVFGWAAVEVERACERALELAKGSQRQDRSYPPLWGLWTVRFLRGELTSALEAAEAVLRMAQASGVRMIELTGHHATSYTLSCRGEFERAIEEADAGLARNGFEQEQELAKAFGLSSSVCLLASRGNARWMLGRVVEAQEDWDRMLQLGRDLQHPPSLAAALAFTLYAGSFRYSYLGQMDRLVDVADELLTLSDEEDFFLWHAIATTYRGAVAEALGDVNRAREQMREGLELFAQTGSRLTLVMMNVVCAEALCRLGDDDEALRRLEVAEAQMTAGHEGLLAPDIWRVRGRLLERQGERSAAETNYRQAIERARAQQARSLELRAALDLYDLQVTVGRAEEARDLLAGLLKGFTQGLDRPELARARAAIKASSS
ncbi:MAG: AAA family ATPase [Actinomycetota bacterium]|nr:AAA family ATPase [Actinomycetota bacterium]